jgi:hypothetical protein
VGHYLGTGSAVLMERWENDDSIAFLHNIHTKAVCNYLPVARTTRSTVTYSRLENKTFRKWFRIKQFETTEIVFAFFTQHNGPSTFYLVSILQNFFQSAVRSKFIVNIKHFHIFSCKNITHRARFTNFAAADEFSSSIESAPHALIFVARFF